MALPRAFNLKSSPTIRPAPFMPDRKGCRPGKTRCKKVLTLKRVRILPFLQKVAYDFRGGMRYQRSTLRHRVFPSSFRPQHPAEQSQVRYPTKILWFVTWL